MMGLRALRHKSKGTTTRSIVDENVADPVSRCRFVEIRGPVGSVGITDNHPKDENRDDS